MIPEESTNQIEWKNPDDIPHRRRGRSTGGMIEHIMPDSIADDLGIQPGDVVIMVNRTIVRDILDYRFATSEETVELLVQTKTGQTCYEIEKDPDEDLGITFTADVFDHVRQCANDCPFCFITQMPSGLRKTLYIKDDDYRLSFLYGNFITLSNLTTRDWERIQQQHLSPLYISVHTTNRLLRSTLLGKKNIPDIRRQLHRLGQAGIQVHTQIVASPGINDGDVLRQTIHDLVALYPTVQSIAVVPVGVTRYRVPHPVPGPDIPIRPYTSEEARQVLEIVLACGDTCAQAHGKRLVYPADEFFLLAGADIPLASFYDDYPQYFNGIGMTRDFITTWEASLHALPPRLPTPTHLALICGKLAEPLLQRVARQLNHIPNLHAQVIPVSNHFFGEHVTVSGLLTGQDVIAAITPGSHTLALLPRAMFDHTGTHTLDDLTPQSIAERIVVPIATAGNPDELIRCLQQLAYG